jgi:hypothetical protein
MMSSACRAPAFNSALFWLASESRTGLLIAVFTVESFVLETVMLGAGSIGKEENLETNANTNLEEEEVKSLVNESPVSKGQCTHVTIAVGRTNSLKLLLFTLLSGWVRDDVEREIEENDFWSDSRLPHHDGRRI